MCQLYPEFDKSNNNTTDIGVGNDNKEGNDNGNDKIVEAK